MTGKWTLQELIIYEDEAVLVIRKPAGLAVESARVYEQDLSGLLRASYGSAYLVHRLDQPVEGLMVCAKNKKAAAFLTAQLQDGRMEKTYLARVSGPVPKEQDTLTDYLAEDRSGKTVVVPPDGNGGTEGNRKTKGRKPRKAVLRYKKRNERTLEIRIDTGRRHQIRAQLAHAGMPIAGDRKYGGEEAPCLCLCASELSYINPLTYERQQWKTTPRLWQ